MKRISSKHKLCIYIYASASQKRDLQSVFCCKIGDCTRVPLNEVEIEDTTFK